MQMKLLNVLACPKCRGALHCEAETPAVSDEVESGTLRCAECTELYPIVNGIPRFVGGDDYAASFGLQWNLFRTEQIDSFRGKDLSAKRFFSESEWLRDDLKRNWILDAGCGAGRFLDIVSKEACDVVGVDMSRAVDAARKTLTGRKNVHLVQASIYELPFRHASFDKCYSIGVIQHTPDPRKSIRTLSQFLKKDGRICLTIYERKPWTMFCTKYLIRPLTKRLNHPSLLLLIKCVLPFLFPITEIAFRIPYLGRFFAYLIPVANYVGHNGDLSRSLSIRERYKWAIMDTFDMLSPEYDQPQTMSEVTGSLKSCGIEDIRRTTLSGLSVVGRKSA